MITHFYGIILTVLISSTFFVTAGLRAFQEIIHWTGAQKSLEPKKKNFIWHFVQKSVHTLVPSGNKVHTPWPLKNKEVVHMHKPLFSVSSWGSQFRSYCGKLKHSPRERCVTDFLFQKDWLSFQNCWETLVQEIPHVCNLDFTHGKDFIWPVISKTTFV